MFNAVESAAFGDSPLLSSPRIVTKLDNSTLAPQRLLNPAQKPRNQNLADTVVNHEAYREVPDSSGFTSGATVHSHLVNLQDHNISIGMIPTQVNPSGLPDLGDKSKYYSMTGMQSSASMQNNSSALNGHMYASPHTGYKAGTNESSAGADNQTNTFAQHSQITLSQQHTSLPFDATSNPSNNLYDSIPPGILSGLSHSGGSSGFASSANLQQASGHTQQFTSSGSAISTYSPFDSIPVSSSFSSPLSISPQADGVSSPATHNNFGRCDISSIAVGEKRKRSTSGEAANYFKPSAQPISFQASDLSNITGTSSLKEQLIDGQRFNNDDTSVQMKRLCQEGNAPLKSAASASTPASGSTPSHASPRTASPVKSHLLQMQRSTSSNSSNSTKGKRPNGVHTNSSSQIQSTSSHQQAGNTHQTTIEDGSFKAQTNQPITLGVPKFNYFSVPSYEPVEELYTSVSRSQFQQNLKAASPDDLPKSFLLGQVPTQRVDLWAIKNRLDLLLVSSQVYPLSDADLCDEANEQARTEVQRAHARQTFGVGADLSSSTDRKGTAAAASKAVQAAAEWVALNDPLVAPSWVPKPEKITGNDRYYRYWNAFDRFLTARISKLEFDTIVRGLLGRNTVYHNAFIAALLRNARSDSLPPKHSNSSSSLAANQNLLLSELRPLPFPYPFHLLHPPPPAIPAFVEPAIPMQNSKSNLIDLSDEHLFGVPAKRIGSKSVKALALEAAQSHSLQTHPSQIKPERSEVRQISTQTANQKLEPSSIDATKKERVQERAVQATVLQNGESALQPMLMPQAIPQQPLPGVSAGLDVKQEGGLELSRHPASVSNALQPAIDRLKSNQTEGLLVGQQMSGILNLLNAQNSPNSEGLLPSARPPMGDLERGLTLFVPLLPTHWVSVPDWPYCVNPRMRNPYGTLMPISNDIIGTIITVPIDPMTQGRNFQGNFQNMSPQQIAADGRSVLGENGSTLTPNSLATSASYVSASASASSFSSSLAPNPNNVVVGDVMQANPSQQTK